MDFLVFLDFIIKSNELFVEVFISCSRDPAPAGRGSLGHNSTELHWGMRNGSDEVVLLHRLVSLGPCASQTSEQNRVTVSAGADLHSKPWKSCSHTNLEGQYKHRNQAFPGQRVTHATQTHWSSKELIKAKSLQWGWKKEVVKAQFAPVSSREPGHHSSNLPPCSTWIKCFVCCLSCALPLCLYFSLSLFLHHLSQWILVTYMQVSSQEEENLWANSTGWG